MATYGQRLERFFVVVDPGPNSELGDICWETSAGEFGRWWKGGMEGVDPCREAEDRNISIYTHEPAAKADAAMRLKARKEYDRALAFARAPV